MSEEVWVWIPHDQEGVVTPAAEELLHEAHGLCRRLGARMVGLSDLDPGTEARRRLGAWGMEEVRTVAPPSPPHPIVDGKRALFPGLGAEGLPRAFLFTADPFGRVAAPLWAAANEAVLVTGATGVTADAAEYVLSRPTHGERFEALVRVPLETRLAVTLLPGAVGRLAAPAFALGEGEAPSLEERGGGGSPAQPGQAGGGGFRIHPPDLATLDIEDAERIVAFGRGAFHSEAVALVEQLAEKLGAVIAGTRPAADEGWLPFSRQVGLTGAIVHPKLYVAVGISGAPYHMVGVKEPEHLLAINQDPKAPIFGSADLGIVGSLYEVLPRLIEELDEGKGLPGAPPEALDMERGNGP